MLTTVAVQHKQKVHELTYVFRFETAILLTVLHFYQFALRVELVIGIMTEEAPVNQTLNQKISGGLSSITGSAKKLPVKKAALSVVVLALKQGVNKLVFKCPEQNYKLYSALFTFVPAVMLFCLGLMISKAFWEIAVGCICLRPGTRRRTSWKRSRKYVYLCCLAPVVWFLFVFVDADYYVCFTLGSLEARLNSTTDPLEEYAILFEFESAKAESHIIALVMLAAMFFFATIFISLDRCCTKAGSDVSDEDEYAQYLTEEKIKLFNMKLEPSAKEQATREVEALFEKYKDVSDPAEKIRLISEQIRKEDP